MGLTSALNAAVSGLRTTQAGLNLVSQNVANAGSAGYTRRTMTPVQSLAGDRTAGVRSGEVQRVLDLVAQRQLRLETSGAAYTGVRATFASALDRIFGTPGTAGSVDGTLNTFTESLQRLVSSPSDYSARTSVLDSANVLAGRIASAAQGIQSLRAEAEGRLDVAVGRANTLLAGVADLNAKIVASQARGANPALLDERDGMLTELSQLMDLQIVEGEGGAVRVMTGSGQTLVDGSKAVRLDFDANRSPSPQSVWSNDPALRGVGTITATSEGGSRVDLVATRAFRSGEIAAALELRDGTLVEAQRQLDELAAGLSLALSETRVEGVSAEVAGARGFTVDLTAAEAGDIVNFSYRDEDGRAKQASILVRNGAGSPPYPTPTSSDPNAPIFELDLSLGFGPAVTALQTQIGAGFQVASVAPQSLRVLENAADTTDMLGLSLSSAAAGVTGEVGLSLFVDRGGGNAPYTGVTAAGNQITGYAQRMGVNPALAADRSRLVVYDTGVLQGDATRPQQLYDRLTSATRTFAAATGIGGVDAPFRSSVTEFARRVVEDQGANAENALRLNEGQKVALATIESRFAESAAVNVDEEMAQLVQLQTAYGANARVMTAVRDMMDMLMRI